MKTVKSWKNQFGLMLGGLSILALSACATTTQAPLQANVVETIPAPIPAPVAVTPQTLRAARLDATLNKFVDAGYLPGVSVMVYEDGAESYYGQAGYRDREAQIPIARTDVGRYYSMTKPIVGVGLMMLYEDGKFALDDPIAKYLPEYANLQVFSAQNEDGSLVLVDPNRPVTIRDLMRHTAGLTYGKFSNTPVDMEYRKAMILQPEDTLAEFSEKIGKLPLLVQPGTQWIYSVGVDVQGRLIEVLSGQTLGEYLEDNIFTPLGMSHTGFVVKDEDKDKFGPAYVVDMSTDAPVLIRLTDENSPKITQGILYKIDSSFLDKQKLESGGGGLVSSIDDYAQFAEMLVKGGENKGTRFLKTETLDMMRQDHLGEIDNGALDDSMGFGLDFAVKLRQIEDPKSMPVPNGSYYWGGLAGTFFWIDPSNEQFVVVHMQFINPVDPTIRNMIAAAVYGE